MFLISRKNTWIFFALSCLMPPAKGLNEMTVTACASGGGLLAGIAAGYFIATDGIEEYIHESLVFNTPFDKQIGASLTGCAVALSIGGLIYYTLNEYTPEGRFSYAYTTISALNNDTFINVNITDPEEAITTIIARFDTGWPLVSACTQLMKKAQMLRSALTSLEIAYADACNNRAKYELIVTGYESLIISATQIHERIKAILLIICKHPRYKQQAASYKHRHKG